MKMMAADYIGAMVVPSDTNPIGDLVVNEAPPGVADFALALRKIDADYTHTLTSGESEGLTMFSEMEQYIKWFAMALGAQHPEYTITLFGEAEADDFENAFVDPDILEDALTIAQGAARAAQIARTAGVRDNG